MKLDRMETRTESGTSKLGPFLLGAIVGAVVGGTLALIYAPAEGVALRRKITDTFDDIADGVGGIVEGARTAADKLFSDGRGKADEIIDRTREKVDDILEDADRAIAEARRRSEDRSREDDE
ncbi:MAG: YtxH domain-containing protein [Bacteroidota bacterium]|nr:YtxH domain-containing protein [Bacteroidota bacterium]MDP4232233.1 YtxH domain-containing protein [Bacteroidota bacterium]MDP4243587.1 YtxH domain-containing protein [Bacteroidota bacterium]